MYTIKQNYKTTNIQKEQKYTSTNQLKCKRKNMYLSTKVHK